MQLPFAQPLAKAGSHVAHAEPLLPHAIADAAVQELPLQHPAHPDDASQMHTPLAHRSPCAQGGLPPQRQAPPTHWSDRGPQLLHNAPSAPHAAAVGAVHWLFEQQPDGQVVGSQRHTPPLHR